MQNPFSSTYSKAPEHTYIFTDEVREIIENFSYDNPSESVYKITGVRGSGKTVILSKVEEEYQKPENQDKGWIVCRVSPNRDMLLQIGTILHNNKLYDAKKDITAVNLSANVFATGGGVGISKEPAFKDIGIELEEMIKYAHSKGMKILIGVDEISKNKPVTEFVAEFGKWLRANYPVYLVCTGLYENIQEIANVKNLTFFRRATTVKAGALNFVKMAEMYKEKLGVDHETGKKMAEATKGYAYAFQELGVISFKEINKDENKDKKKDINKEIKNIYVDEIIDKLKVELFSYSYEKIWEEMTENDRFFIKQMTDKKEYKREELLNKLGDKQGMYSVYRDRMVKRGIIIARHSYISLALPFMGDYIRDYCLD